MVALPTKAEIEQSESKTAKKPRMGNIPAFIAQLPGAAAETELTVAAGTVTPNRYLNRVDTESDAAADNLDNILLDNLPDGSRIRLRAENAARIVTLRHQQGGDGEIVLTNGEACALDDAGKWIILERRGTQWVEVLRSTVFGRRVVAAASAAALRTLADVSQAIANMTENTSPAVSDFFAMNVGGADRKVQIANALKRLTGLTALTAIALDDELLIYDLSGTAAKKIVPAELLKALALLDADATPDIAADYLLSYDASAQAVKKVLANTVGRGRLIQQVANEYATYTSIATPVPLDDSAPQDTEGAVTASVAITLGNAANKVFVAADMQAYSNNSEECVMSIFRGSTLLTTKIFGRPTGGHFALAAHAVDAPGSVGPHTYKIVAGPSGSGTLFINGNNSSRQHGGGQKSVIIASEIAA